MFLGRKITKRCGNEGQHKDLEEKQAAISYTSEATNMGADLSNGEFTFFGNSLIVGCLSNFVSCPLYNLL